MARPINEDRPSKLNRSERPIRVPVNGVRDRLVVHGKEPGWHYCLVNGHDVAHYELGGYEKVSHEVRVGDRKIDSAAMIGGFVVIPGGAGVDLVLMRIPEELHQEDMDDMHRRVDESEAAMKEALNSKQDGRYGKVEIAQSKPLNK